MLLFSTGLSIIKPANLGIHPMLPIFNCVGYFPNPSSSTPLLSPLPRPPPPKKDSLASVPVFQARTNQKPVFFH